MKSDAKCKTSGGLRYLGVTEVNGDSTIRYSAYEFLLAFHRPVSLSCAVPEIQRDIGSKIADFSHTRPAFGDPFGMTVTPLN